MMVTEDETFGPVAPIVQNSTPKKRFLPQRMTTIFGLASYFYSNDLSRVTRMQEGLEYGIVGVNSGIISTEVAPFGGWLNNLDWGREGSHHGIEDFLELKIHLYVSQSIKIRMRGRIGSASFYGFLTSQSRITFTCASLRSVGV